MNNNVLTPQTQGHLISCLFDTEEDLNSELVHEDHDYGCNI